MASDKRMKWAELDPAVRVELEGILEAHRLRQSPLAARFHSDADELMPFVLLGFLAAVGGMIACVYLITSSTSEYADIGYLQRLKYLVQSPHSLATSPEGGVVGAGLVALALAIFWIRHRGRRGLAITGHALVIVRGPRLRILPLAEIASSAQTGRGKRGARFTVLELTMKDGRRQNLTTSKNWADAAEAQLTARR